MQNAFLKKFPYLLKIVSALISENLSKYILHLGSIISSIKYIQVLDIWIEMGKLFIVYFYSI